MYFCCFFFFVGDDALLFGGFGRRVRGVFGCFMGGLFVCFTLLLLFLFFQAKHPLLRRDSKVKAEVKVHLTSAVA